MKDSQSPFFYRQRKPHYIFSDDPKVKKLEAYRSKIGQRLVVAKAPITNPSLAEYPTKFLDSNIYFDANIGTYARRVNSDIYFDANIGVNANGQSFNNQFFVGNVGASYTRIANDIYFDGLVASDTVLSGLVSYFDAALSTQNQGTPVGNPTWSSNDGGYYNFNGSGQYFEMPIDAFLPTGSAIRTLCASFRVTSLASMEVMGIGGNSGLGNRTSIWVDGSNRVGVECLNTAVVTSSWAGAGNWVYLCAVQKGTGTFDWDIYINGSLTSTTNIGSSGTLNTSNAGYRIGAIPTYNGGFFFNGRIGVVQVYNRALTPTEVLSNFNGIRGRYGL